MIEDDDRVILREMRDLLPPAGRVAAAAAAAVETTAESVKQWPLRPQPQLPIKRRVQRWANKEYNKSHSLSAMKANPLGGSSMAKGIVVEKIGIEAKQPNSAIRKCVRVQLIKNGKKITAFVPNDGS